MDKWHVEMKFEGDVAALSASHAIADFKTTLGLAPAAMRSEVHLTELNARRWDDPQVVVTREDLDPRFGGDPSGLNLEVQP